MGLLIRAYRPVESSMWQQYHVQYVRASRWKQGEKGCCHAEIYVPHYLTQREAWSFHNIITSVTDFTLPEIFAISKATTVAAATGVVVRANDKAFYRDEVTAQTAFTSILYNKYDIA